MTTGVLPARAAPTEPPLLVLIPIYNDWEAVSLLLVQLDRVLASSGLTASVLLVDDASTEPMNADMMDHAFNALVRVEVLGLRRNIGHQRAIAIGLAFAHEQRRPGTVLVMDGDGEDAPDDVPRLLARLNATGNGKVIFAARQRRTERLTFRLFYVLYRFAHRVLTGIPVRVGNFSAIPGALVGRLVVVSELWNHYAAAVFKARLPHESIPTARAKRLSGRSRMNFVALVSHGLSALSVHADVIGVRLLVLAALMVVLLSGLIATVVGVRMLTSLAIPGWATTAGGLLAIVLIETIAGAVFFSFLVLHGRSQPLFIPIRDYSFFVEGVRHVYPSVVRHGVVRGIDGQRER
jgi:polyisoprenyl-phosphate glycosyltransferase